MSSIHDEQIFFSVPSVFGATVEASLLAFNPQDDNVEECIRVAADLAGIQLARGLVDMIA